jgi:hypothetical protein
MNSTTLPKSDWLELPETVIVPLPCEMLVDQKRFIGSDPVGYKCMEPAVHVVGNDWNCGFYLCCDRCYKMLCLEPERIMFPPHAGAPTKEAAVERSRRMMRETIDSALKEAST